MNLIFGEVLYGEWKNLPCMASWDDTLTGSHARGTAVLTSTIIPNLVERNGSERKSEMRAFVIARSLLNAFCQRVMGEVRSAGKLMHAEGTY